MEGKRLLHSLRLKNFLSYGSEGVEIGLLPLNVLIGPNASGKSNLIEAIEVLHAAPRDLAEVFRRGGGAGEYVWKGGPPDAVMRIEAEVEAPRDGETGSLAYALGVAESEGRLKVVSESLASSAGKPGDVLHPGGEEPGSEQSILSQRRDPERFPEVAFVAGQFERIVSFPANSFTRAGEGGGADLPAGFLLPSGSNLALVLGSLHQRADTRKELRHHVRRLYSPAEMVTTRARDGVAETFAGEEFQEPVPSPRLSSGTLRYLCLLAILLHPSPPPLVCLEEPELGLHPDVLPDVAELLVRASVRTQLIVATHSDTLVSALPPESVIVCERGPAGTSLRRLNPVAISEWLDRYSLGELWRMGEIGGTR